MSTEGALTSRAETQEVLALRLSLLLVILFAAGAVLVATYSVSETMTLEALSAGVDIVISSLAVFVARKVRAPPTTATSSATPSMSR